MLVRNLASLLIAGYYHEQPITTWLRTHSQALTTHLRRRPMKPFKNLVFAALLVFGLAFNTLAGDVDVPGAPKPLTYTEDPVITNTKPTSTTTQETGAVTAEPSDYLFYEALVAFLSVY